MNKKTSFIIIILLTILCIGFFCRKTEYVFNPEVGIMPIKVLEPNSKDTIKNNIPVALIWQDETSYKLGMNYLLSIKENENMYVDLPTTADTQIILNFLKPNKTYTIQITSKRQNDSKSLPSVFHKIITYQDPFFLISTADKSTKVEVDNVFNWERIKAYYKNKSFIYNVHFSLSDNFTNDTVIKTTDTFITTTKELLKYSKIYYWKVVALYNDGTEAISSPVWSFTSKDPPAFSYNPIVDYIQNSPQNNSTLPVFVNGIPGTYFIINSGGLTSLIIDPNNGTLVWNPATPIGTYNFQLNNTNSFAFIKYTLVIKKIPVQFESNGGSIVPQQSLAYKDLIIRPVDPTKGSYTFKNWYADNSLSIIYDFNIQVINDKTLYAKWLINVSFNTNGASTPTPPLQILEFNAKVTRPPDPTRIGYTFKGWGENYSSTAFDFNKQIIAPTTLVAIWEANYFFYSPASGNFVTNGTSNNSGTPTFIGTPIGTYSAYNLPQNVSLNTITGVISWNGRVPVGRSDIYVSNSNAISGITYRFVVTDVSVTCSVDHKSILQDLYNSAGGSNWINKTNWMTTEPLGNWAGVGTNANGCVTTLNLDNNRLQGSIPTSIGGLGYLTVLDMHNNRLSGALPSTLSNLTNLEYLDLSINTLAGSLPSDFGRLQSLKELYLQNNIISGIIPSSITTIASLSKINISSNQFSGALPDAIGSLQNLTSLNCSYNSLSQNIPTSIGSLTNLIYLDLQYNFLLGNIPSSIGNLINLKYLYLTRNNLYGVIPTSIGSLANIENININDNQLDGKIPNEICNLIKLQNLNLSKNKLSNGIPLLLGNLVALEYLHLEYNLLTDSIPSSIGYIPNLKQLHLENNKLTDSIPMQLGNLVFLNELYLNNNTLTKSIPSSLGNLSNLQALFLDHNKLTGSVPLSICNRKNLYFQYGTNYNVLFNGNNGVPLLDCTP